MKAPEGVIEKVVVEENKSEPVLVEENKSEPILVQKKYPGVGAEKPSKL